MSIQFKANVTEPLPKNTEEINLAPHRVWLDEVEAAVNEAETGWRDLAEALEHNGLFVLDDEKNQVVFCSPQGGDRDHKTRQTRAMIQASAEGRLFIRAKDTGMLMQLRTKSLSFEKCELELSEQVHEIPGVEGLEAAVNVKKPSVWARIAAWFAPNSKYGQQVAAYEAYMAGSVKLPESKAASEPAVEEFADRHQRVEEQEKQAQQIQQVQQVAQQPKENEQPQEHPTYGLKNYSEEGVKAGFARMKYSEEAAQKAIPADSPVKLNGTELGALVAMAMGNPELSITSKSGNKHINDPDVTYKDFVGSYLMQGNPLTNKMTAGFKMAAERAVGAALKQAAAGDFTKLATIIANGLTQNNKMLQNQKELSDVYTGYAELGQMALKIMNGNENLKNAVMDQLGADTKQIDIANNAKNVSDFRVDAMKTYQKMSKNFYLFAEYKVHDENGNEIIKETPVATYNTRDVAKVALLSDLEMDMNFGKFNLENTKFADPDAAKNIIKDYETSEVLNALLWERNRGDILQNPVQMQNLFKAATDELQGVLDLKNAEREQGLDYEDLYMDNERPVGKEEIDLQKIFG